MIDDLLANVEREPHERPRTAAPLEPDVETETSLEYRSVTAQIREWRVRCLAAEAELALVRHRLLLWKCTT
jgi:hypothetical protein